MKFYNIYVLVYQELALNLYKNQSLLMETSDINHDQNMTPVQFDEVVTWSLADFTGLSLNFHTGKW